MTDSKELGITVTGDVQDAQDKLSDLVDTINGLVDKAIDITVNVNDAGVEAVQADLEVLDNETISPNVDSTAIEDLSTNASVASQEIMDTSIASDDLSSSLMSIDSTAINEAAAHAAALGQEMSNTSNETSNMSSNMSGAGTDISSTTLAITGLSSSLGGMGGEFNSAFMAMSKFNEQIGWSIGPTELLAAALAAVVAIGIVTYLAEATGAAGEFQDSWSRLGEAVDMGGVAIGDVQDEWTGAINIMKDETGRSAGVIRNHIISMGLAGVESKDIIEDSFSGISGAAFVTGNSIDTIESAFRRVVSTGVLSTRQLMSFGITTEDVFNATGMTMDSVRDKFQSLDTEGRAALLSLILNQKYGATANEAYKQSWQHLGDAMAAVWKGLEIAIGKLVLPIVMPAMEGLIWVVNGLSWAINTVAGYFTGFNDAVGNTSILLGGLSLALGPMGLLLTPLGVAAGFIADNWGRLNASWTQFWTMISTGDWGGALQLLVDELKWAFVDAPLAYLASLPGRIGEFAGAFYDWGVKVVDWIVQGLWSLDKWLADQLFAEFAVAGADGAAGAADGFSKWWDDNWPKIYHILETVIVKIIPLLGAAIVGAILVLMRKAWDALANWMGKLMIDMATWGKNAFDSFVNAIIDGIPGLRWALDQVSKLFPHSPPKEGPLSEITAKGMGDWMSGIMNAGMDAAANFNLNNVSLPTPNPTNIVNSNRVGGAVFNINVPMQGAGKDDKTALETGKQVGKGIVSELEGWALDGGLSTINAMRSV